MTTIGLYNIGTSTTLESNKSPVVTDIAGVSARAMLEAILAGQRDVETLADLARGRLRAKRDQLQAA